MAPGSLPAQWHTASMPQDMPTAAEVTVACLCAAWCRTCDEYRQVLLGLAGTTPGVRYLWVDIEDHADALDDPQHAATDIENFPTLLVIRGAQPVFFGTVLPHAGVVERLVDRERLRDMAALQDAAAVSLAAAVLRLADTGTVSLTAA